MNKSQIAGAEPAKNEIIVYQPDETLRLDVRLESETVWLTRSQLCDLFGVVKSNVSYHLKNIFASDELDHESTVQIIRTVQNEGVRRVFRDVEYYNLDVIISLGFRVNSARGIKFRQWANGVLRDHLLRGYSVSARINQLEDKVDRRFADQGRQIQEISEQVGFFIRTEMPPREGVLFEGQIKDGYDLALRLIRQARGSVVLIDNWVDERVLTMLEARAPKATAMIYTRNCTKKLQLDVANHNRQYRPIVLKAYRGAHDRFLIVDETVYHIGASLKDLGTALFAFSRMEIPAKLILDSISVPGASVE